MKLAAPLWLSLLPLAALLPWVKYGRHSRPTVMFSSLQELGTLPRTWRQKAYYLLPLACAAGIFSLLLAAARPQRPVGVQLIRTKTIDFVLIIDTSTSMRAEDMSDKGRRINRLDAAKLVAKDFIVRRPHDRIGLIAFAAMPYVFAPLTLDHDWLINRIEELRTGMLEDATAIGDAIASGLNRLRSSQARSKVIVLLTDGVNNAGALDPRKAADMARILGVKVYTVGVGTRGWAPYPVLDEWGNVHYVPQPVDIDEDLLREISSTTGGQYFRATDLSAMKKAYQTIDRLERSEIVTKQYTRYEELYPHFIAAALVFLIVERILAGTVLLKLP